jgi:hypothetical protein
MSVVSDLKAARDLITPRTRWIKDDEITVKGFSGNIDNEDLMDLFLHIGLTEKTCFCASGAIKFVTKNNDTRYEAAIKALGNVVKEDDDEEKYEDFEFENIVTEWNDDSERTHAQVLAAFDEAIKQKSKK